MSIVLGPPSVTESTISVSVDAGDASRWLESGTLQVDYQGGIDLAEIDPALLVLPALGAILPVCYASGIPVRVDTVDALFATAAERMAPLWSASYPKFAASDVFALEGKRVSATRTPTVRRAALLYSGGLDSATSLLANRDHVRTLVSVWGGDISLPNQSLWNELATLISESPLAEDCRQITARTNWRDLVKQFRLIHDFLDEGGDWWAGVQHGLTLLTLAAPVTAAQGLERIYIASSHTAEYLVPHGSAPETDNLIQWTGTDVFHDSFELTRQQKITQHIAPYLRAGGSVALAVCHQPGRGGGTLNCGDCEKCIRTATGLLVAGIAPADAGLTISPAGYDKWRAELTSGARTLDINELYMWCGLQTEIPGDLTGISGPARGYVEWVRDFDFDTAARRPTSWRDRLRPALRYQFRRAADHLPRSTQQALKSLKSRPELPPAMSVHRESEATADAKV